LFLNKTIGWRAFHSNQVLKELDEQAQAKPLVHVVFHVIFHVTKVEANKTKKNERQRGPRQ
jgi:hypothetical protein